MLQHQRANCAVAARRGDDFSDCIEHLAQIDRGQMPCTIFEEVVAARFENIRRRAVDQAHALGDAICENVLQIVDRGSPEPEF